MRRPASSHSLSTLDSRLNSQRGSYKGSRQVYQLRALSGLGFELPERMGINDHAIELVNVIAR